MKRKDRRHSNFWAGIYRVIDYLLVIAWNYFFDIVHDPIALNLHKIINY
ncbi:MAG: hypothetical protein WBA93_04030 [Microcoleaceae cyanobacterium]